MAASAYIGQSLASSTSSKYLLCLDQYIAWASFLNLVAYPLHEANLVLYASQIALHSSYSNVKLHLAAIKHFAVAHGYSLGQYDRLYLVMRGIRRNQGRRLSKPKRAPVTPGLLRRIKTNLFLSDHTYGDKCMLWSAITIAFFGLLRASEYTCKYVSRYDPELELCLSDVSCTPIGIAITLKTSKTDIF